MECPRRALKQLFGGKTWPKPTSSKGIGQFYSFQSQWDPVNTAFTDFSFYVYCYRYWRYNEDMRTMDPGYPKPITVWKGIPDSPQGAFVDKANGRTLK